MQRENAIRQLLLFLLLLLWGGLKGYVSAQSNPYNISPTLYPLYVKGAGMLANPEALVWADSLMHESRRLGDPKAECLGAVIRFRHYTQGHERKPVEREAAHLREVSRRNGYSRYYYYAYQLEVVWLLNHGFGMAALQRCETMRREAYTENDAYGIYNCLRTMGQIYYSRSCFEMAKGYYEQSLRHVLDYLPEQPPSDAYFSLATVYITKHDEDNRLKGLEYARMAETTGSKMKDMQVKAIELQACFNYRMGRFEDFEKDYARAKALRSEMKLNSSIWYTMMEMYKAVCDKRFDDALAYADAMVSKPDRLQYRSRILQKMGKDKAALYVYELYVRARDSLYQAMHAEDLAEMNAQFETQQLKHENTLLDLRNSELRLKQMQQQVDLERSQAENTQLTLENRELELQKLKAAAEMQQIESERQRLENERQRLINQQQKSELEKQRISSRYRFIISMFLVGVLAISVLLLALYLRRRHRLLRQLRDQNRELEEERQRTEVALQRAEEANRMKSIFIQNMSHEIRTPLNSIVGFSQLLAAGDEALSAEEREEFSRLIEHNSDLLTTLVNDILGLSELESGMLQLDRETVHCNALCRETIATVAHRCPQGVKLYYTTEVADDYTITSDGKRIKEVLINFLTNAEKCTTEGEIHLHLSLSAYPDRLTFSVTDTGKGIPADQAEAIFERFKKLDAFAQGSGLGLNICRLIAEMMHGEVKVDATYTQGARFLFILPLQV